MDDMVFDDGNERPKEENVLISLYVKEICQFLTFPSTRRIYRIR